MPDITRLFKGPQNEFEVEVVFAEQGDQSPSEAHPFEEIIVTLAGVFQVDLKDQKTVTCDNHPGFMIVPAGVEHQITVVEAPVRLVIIHPDRT